MSDKTFIELIDDAIADGSLTLPVFPAVITELFKAAADPKSSADTIAQKISQDAALASQVLRVANSPFYSGLNKVSNIRLAVARLGLAPTVQIATMVAQKTQFQSSNPLFQRNLEILWRHGVACSLGSEWLAKRIGMGAVASDAFMCGLFHDIGKLLLLKAIDEIQKRPRAVKLPDDVLYETLERFHAEKGAKLLEAWNLPEIFADIARNHHQPLTAQTSNLDLLVRVVDLAARKMGIGFHHQPDLMITNTDEAQRLGISTIVLAELEIALEDSVALAA